MTLRELMNKRGIRYNSIFGYKAKDMYFETSDRIFCALGFLLSHCQHFEFEIPENDTQTYRSYPIANGRTSGGHIMKQKDHYRRITGSLFVEACYYLGFVAGVGQDYRNIEMNISSLIQTQQEEDAFKYGFNL